MGGMKANARINQNKKQTKTVLARVGWYHKNAEVELFCSISYNFMLLEISKFMCILKEIDIEQNKRPPRRNWANKGEREGEFKKMVFGEPWFYNWCPGRGAEPGRDPEPPYYCCTPVVHISMCSTFYEGRDKKKEDSDSFNKTNSFFFDEYLIQKKT